MGNSHFRCLASKQTKHLPLGKGRGAWQTKFWYFSDCQSEAVSYCIYTDAQNRERRIWLPASSNLDFLSPVKGLDNGQSSFLLLARLLQRQPSCLSVKTTWKITVLHRLTDLVGNTGCRERNTLTHHTLELACLIFKKNPKLQTLGHGRTLPLHQEQPHSYLNPEHNFPQKYLTAPLVSPK